MLTPSSPSVSVILVMLLLLLSFLTPSDVLAGIPRQSDPSSGSVRDARDAKDQHQDSPVSLASRSDSNNMNSPSSSLSSSSSSSSLSSSSSSSASAGSPDDPKSVSERAGEGHGFHGNDVASENSETDAAAAAALYPDSVSHRERRSSSREGNTTSNSSAKTDDKVNSTNRKRKGKKKRKSRKKKGRTAAWSEDVQVGCRELRARRYITDGFCTSDKPIKEVVCAGNCLPIRKLPWYAEFVKTMVGEEAKEWQCVEGIVKRRRIRLLCKNGEARFYRIPVVKSCQCEKVSYTNSTKCRQRRCSVRRRKSRNYRKDRKDRRSKRPKTKRDDS